MVTPRPRSRSATARMQLGPLVRDQPAHPDQGGLVAAGRAAADPLAAGPRSGSGRCRRSSAAARASRSRWTARPPRRRDAGRPAAPRALPAPGRPRPSSAGNARRTGRCARGASTHSTGTRAGQDARGEERDAVLAVQHGVEGPPVREQPAEDPRVHGEPPAHPGRPRSRPGGPPGSGPEPVRSGTGPPRPGRPGQAAISQAYRSAPPAAGCQGSRQLAMATRRPFTSAARCRRSRRRNRGRERSGTGQQGWRGEREHDDAGRPGGFGGQPRTSRRAGSPAGRTRPGRYPRQIERPRAAPRRQ